MLLLLLFAYFNLGCIYVVFMMHKLNSLGLLSYTNSNQLEIRENEFQKLMTGTNAKEIFSAS